MPIIDGIKFSCAPCVKGHRSANCPHEGRPLIEIKKKGRPTLSCETCKELRKTKASITKCVCPPSTNTAESTAPTTLSRNPSSSASTSARKLNEPKHRSAHSHRNHYDPLFPFNQPPHDSSITSTAATNQYTLPHRQFESDPQNKGKQVYPQYDPYALNPAPNHPPSSHAIYFPPPNPFNPSIPLPFDSSLLPDSTQYPPTPSSCFCGSECDCPGCPVHFPLSPEEIQVQLLGGTGRDMACGAQCMSFGLCSASGALSLPAGISSMEELLSIVQTQTSQSPLYPPPLPPPIPEQFSAFPLASPYHTPTNTDVSAIFEQQLSALQAWPSTSDLARFRSSSFTSDYSGSHASSAQSSVHEGYEPNSTSNGIGFDGEGQRFSEAIGDVSQVTREDEVEGIARWRKELPELELDLGDRLILETGAVAGTMGGGAMYGFEEPFFPPANTNVDPYSFLSTQSVIPPPLDYPPLPSPSSTYYYYPSDYAPSSQSIHSVHSSSASPAALYRSTSTSSSASYHGSVRNGSVAGDRYDEQSSGYAEGEGMFEEMNLGYASMDSAQEASSIPLPTSSASSSNEYYSHLVPSPEPVQSTTFEPASPPRRSPSTHNPSLALDRYKTERPPDPLPPSSTNSLAIKSKSKLSFGGFGSSFSRSNSNDSAGSGKGKAELSMERTRTERPVILGDTGNGSGSALGGEGRGKGFVGMLKKVKDKF